MNRSPSKLRRLWSAACSVSLIVPSFHAAQSYAEETCEALLSPAHIDYGLQTPGALLRRSMRQDTVSFQPRTVSLIIQCAQPTPIIIRFLGIAADTDSYQFGINGGMTLTLEQAKLDGRSVNLSTVQGPGLPFGQVDSFAVLRPNQAIVPIFEGQQASGHRLSLTVRIAPIIPEASMRVRELTRWQASGQFTVMP